MGVLGATSSQLLWYTTRASGVVALVLLSASVVLGVATSVRWQSRRWPGFAVADLHRRVSLLGVVFVALHVVTTVSDAYAPIGWLSVFVPFTSPYRRLWLGLGAVALDLLLAVALSSVLRRWISARSWRALHWLAYVSWPVAVVHGLGTGTDPHLRWMLVLTVACVLAVLAAIGWRLARGWPARTGLRIGAGAGALLTAATLGLWARTGPLRPGWASRAGTPPGLLATAAASQPASAPGGEVLAPPPYDAALSGSSSWSASPDGLDLLTLDAQTGGALDAVLTVRISGLREGGGISMQTSSASFGTQAAPGLYQGSVADLSGDTMVLALSDATGSQLELQVTLQLVGSEVTGHLTSVPAGASASAFGAAGGADGRTGDDR